MPRRRARVDLNNPFRIGGVVTPPHFTDREAELVQVRQALTEPQAHLLVYGRRRMGKTSILRVVQEELEAAGHPVILADLSTASALADVTTRLLQAATRALGRRWDDAVGTLLGRMQVRVQLAPDSATGLLLPSLDVGLREVDLATQQRSLTAVLEAIEALAAAKHTHIGVILDEFQELHRFGAEAAEWHLRGVIQEQHHVTYVLAGSDERLIQAMLGRGRAFYQLLDTLRVGPIEPAKLAAWIEARCAEAGVPAVDLGRRIVTLVGPRTRDIVQLARKTFEEARPTGSADSATVEEAFRQIVEAEEAPHRAVWESVSPLQENVLRALAVAASGLTTKATRRQFSLGATGAATKAAQTLVARDLLVKEGTRYHFDSPYFRGWVLQYAVPDVGLTLPLTHLPAAQDEG